jgi:hypothetical protein
VTVRCFEQLAGVVWRASVAGVVRARGRWCYSMRRRPGTRINRVLHKISNNDRATKIMPNTRLYKPRAYHTVVIFCRADDVHANRHVRLPGTLQISGQFGGPHSKEC